MRTRLHARRSVQATVLAAVAGTAVACGGTDTP
jgi:endoglucanase